MDNSEETQLVITEDIRSYLYQTAKWAKFLSIIGFILTAFVVMLALSPGAFLASMSNAAGPNNPYAGLGTLGISVMFILFAMIYFYPSFMLFKYAGQTKQAVLYGDQAKLEASVSSMKSFFKFWGVLTIVILGFYALAFVSFLIGMAA